MAQVMRRADGLGGSSLQPSDRFQRAADLRHLNAVRQTVAAMVAFRVDEDLRLVLQAAEGRRMHDAVAVAPIVEPVGMRILGIATGCSSLLCMA